MSATIPTAVDQATTTDLFALALALPEKDRAALLAQLIRSLDPDELVKEPDHEEAWAAEIERRSQSLHEGRAKLIPREEFEAEMRASLAKGRRP